MHEYLAAHPDAFMSDLKEPHYFGRDLEMSTVWRVRDEANYLGLFRDAGGATRVGESSTWYMYSESAAEEIYRFDPDARVIVMLRNPADAMYSLHGQFLWSCNEDIPSFEAALAAQADRRAGRRIPAEAFYAAGLQYEQVFRFHEQVRRYLHRFSRERVQVILFEDFVRDTPRAYRETLEFLGLDPSFTPPFETANAVKPVNPTLNRFLARRPGLRKLIHGVVPKGVLRRGIDLLPMLLPTLKRPRKLDPELRNSLLLKFEDDVSALSDLLGRDLVATWIKGADVAANRVGAAPI